MESTQKSAEANPTRTGLNRELGLLALSATGICSMLGAGINVVPFMIQRNVPGIGPYVLGAYLLAAVPAVLAALAYAVLSSAMPRAGGSYVYASRALNPYLGFVASFSQWLGLSIAIGVVSYVLIPFLRDIASAFSWRAGADALDTGGLRLALSLGFLWLFVGINLRGIKSYVRTLVPLMFLMFALGSVVIIAGFTFDHEDFASALLIGEERVVPDNPSVTPFEFGSFLAAAALLFSSFIGFDSIAQAGGEARNPSRALPAAILISISVVGTFYFLFTGAVYHAVPWKFIAQEAALRDVTAPGLLGHLLSPGWTIAIVGGAAIALINDLPAMLLAVSRLTFAWSEDGIFPRVFQRVHPKWHTPHMALLASGGLASAGILGSHLAGDFFLGVDILVTSMLVNFLLMCLSVLKLPRRNPGLARQIRVLPSRRLQIALAGTGVLLLALFLGVHIWKDFAAPVRAWYLHSTLLWLLVMLFATGVFLRELMKLRREGRDIKAIFGTLPPE